MNHVDHLDKHLVEELAHVARETVRDELREQARRQRRRAALYAASGAVALYAGAAVALAAGLGLAVVLPDWAAALITGALLGVVAHGLRRAGRPSASPNGAAAERSAGAAPGFGAIADGPPPVPPSKAAPGVPPAPRHGDDPARPQRRA